MHWSAKHRRWLRPDDARIPPFTYNPAEAEATGNMPKEIERKFLAGDGPWRHQTAVTFRQGYLNRDRDRTVRVRVAGEQGYLTIKGLTVGATRLEYEYEIPFSHACELLDTLCERPLIEKNRYQIEHAGKRWEVDEFFGDNEGLVVAEIELDREDEPLDIPDWVGREVTADPRYFNVNLTTHPFKNWSDDTS